MQTINSAGKLRGNEPATSGANSNEMLQLTKIIIQKQSELNNYINIGSRQQMLYNKMSKLKRALVDSDSNIKTLLVYLKEAEQILSSAVYQSKIKLNMIKKAKALPADLLIRYAHKISSDYGVCCPENWVPDNPKRPYPTDADMRRGWLMQVSNIAGDLSKTEPADSVKPNLLRSTSKSNISFLNLIVIKGLNYMCTRTVPLFTHNFHKIRVLGALKIYLQLI